MNFDELLNDATSLLPEIVAIRRTIHRQPEIGLQLPNTQAVILDAISDLDLEVHTGKELTSVLAILRGARPGPTVLLRGDMDALPMPERTGLEFSSEVEGAMHACAHDIHSAMLVGAARLLSARRDELSGDVAFMFQPGEEGYHGARFMIDEGMLERTKPQGAFALHMTSLLESGVVANLAGTVAAAQDQLRIVVTGKGGHASRPETSIDPIPIACEIVQAMQTVVSRRVSPFDPAVITVGQITAGTTHNVIPGHAVLHGTIRTLSEETRAIVHESLEALATGIADAHGAKASVEITPGYPVLVNDERAVAFVREVASGIVGNEKILELERPVMGSEDFSYVLNRVPGAMSYLGSRPPNTEGFINHSSEVVYHEPAMAIGIAIFAGVALQFYEFCAARNVEERVDRPA